jgi:hypothetical protein
MNTKEYLLTCLSEECSEVSHRISKALRFGLQEIEPEQEFTNAERITTELTDLIAIAELLNEMNLIPTFHNEYAKNIKRQKVHKYMMYSKKIGVLQ